MLLWKREGSASHFVELILDLTTNIQDRDVEEVNYILGTQRAMPCIDQISADHLAKTNQILLGIKTNDLVIILLTNQRALHLKQRL